MKLAAVPGLAAIGAAALAQAPGGQAPNGPRYHHYVFEFNVLNAKLDLPASAGRAELWEAMQGRVAAKAAYGARFRNDTNAPRPGGAGGPGGAAPGGAPRAAGQ